MCTRTCIWNCVKTMDCSNTVDYDMCHPCFFVNIGWVIDFVSHLLFEFCIQIGIILHWLLLAFAKHNLWNVKCIWLVLQKTGMHWNIRFDKILAIFKKSITSVLWDNMKICECKEGLVHLSINVWGITVRHNGPNYWEVYMYVCQEPIDAIYMFNSHNILSFYHL